MTRSPIARADLDALKRDHPLAKLLVEAGVRLRRTAEGRLIGRCPFHQDRRPSLMVDERDQHFHCFGCGAHGDVITYVMRRDGVGFAEARARLEASPPPTKAYVPQRPATPVRRWDRLTIDEQEVMNLVAAFYQDALWRQPRLLAYLHERGIPDETIAACGLGYADGHSLRPFLRRQYALRIAEELGLLRKAKPGYGAVPLQEFLGGRIVIPELRGGHCIWFIGRAVDDPEPDHRQRPRPKYLALGGERPVLGVERAARQREVFLCEGVFDYLSAVSWGLPAFSPCGTHLPAQRLGFLAGAEVVYGVLDGDAAGREAAEAFGEQLGQRWRPLLLPEGSDLNDLAQRREGRAVFFRLLTEASATHGGEVADGDDAEG